MSMTVPERFQQASLIGFAQYGLEPEKRDVYEVAQAIAKNDGWIINGGGTKKYGLTIYGAAYGIGKTYLATAIYNVLTKTRSGAWLYYPEFISLAQKGYKDEIYKMLEIARSIDVLLIDDLGQTEYAEVSPYISNVIRDIVGYRHLHLKITLLTTNKPSSTLISLYGEDTFHRIGELTKLCVMAGKQLRDLR